MPRGGVDGSGVPPGISVRGVPQERDPQNWLLTCDGRGSVDIVGFFPNLERHTL